MIPIHALLSRLRWDAEFGRGKLELGYFDRVEGRVVRLPMDRIEFPPRPQQAFQWKDGEGAVHRVPLHRVREVFKDGRRIWHRPDPE